MGLSAVCDCGISLSYSLTILFGILGWSDIQLLKHRSPKASNLVQNDNFSVFSLFCILVGIFVTIATVQV